MPSEQRRFPWDRGVALGAKDGRRVAPGYLGLPAGQKVVPVGLEALGALWSLGPFGHQSCDPEAEGCMVALRQRE